MHLSGSEIMKSPHFLYLILFSSLVCSFLSAQQKRLSYELTELLELNEKGKPFSRMADYPGKWLNIGQAASTVHGMQMELTGPSGEVLRLGDQSNIRILHSRQIHIHQGNLILYLPPSTLPYLIQTPTSRLALRESGTIQLQIMSNGGLKLVSLEGNLQLQLPNAIEDLQPGKLYLLPPGSPILGRQIDIHLKLVTQTSSLLNEFPSPLPSRKQIRDAAFRQSFYIKQKTPMFVGDAKSEEEFDLLLIQP
jgi:hypothetical protein